jgi:hypothetical protein
VAKEYGMKTLGGPPGLFDGPNLDRETNGGIVQRTRVPQSDEIENVYLPGRFQTNSFNDSDTMSDLVEGRDRADNQSPTCTPQDLEGGVPFTKDITGCKI